MADTRPRVWVSQPLFGDIIGRLREHFDVIETAAVGKHSQHEIAAMLAGEIGRAEALERAQAATRQYAKRQYTWLRHQPPADWPRTDATDIINRMPNFARIV